MMSMPPWLEWSRDVMGLLLPVAVTAVGGWIGLRERNRNAAAKQRESEREAILADRGVTTESWESFVEQQRRWADQQEAVVVRQNNTIDALNSKVTALYDQVGEMRTAMLKAERRGADAVMFARRWIEWAVTALHYRRRDEALPPPPLDAPASIAGDVDDVLNYWR